MKIAIIGTAFPFRGGLAAYIERMAITFQEQGHEVVIYTFTIQYPNFLFPGKSQYSSGPKPGGLSIVECINSINPLNWISVGRKIRKSNPDLVLIKYWLPFMGPCFGTILRQIKKGTKAKVIAIIDNIIPHEARIGDKLFTKYFVKPVDGFVAMSENVLEEIEIFDTQKPKLLSPHPIFDNFGQIEPRATAIEKLNYNPKYRYILFFGLIRDYKGLDLLIESFADKRFREHNIKLIIAGEYYTSSEPYQNLIKKYELEDHIIQIDRFIPNLEVANYFNVSDLLVLPYKTATQSGVTQIAYHFNKPMIVTNVGGLAKMCPDGIVGYVVNLDTLELSDAILKFFNDDQQQIMIENVKQEKKKYSWEILIENIFKLADQL